MTGSVLRDYKRELALKLMVIHKWDAEKEYDARNTRIYEAIALALREGFRAGIRIDPDEPEWPVAFIELPTGQVSYHLEQHGVPWDGHTTEEKNARLVRYFLDFVND